jgi:hypothetical protein
MHITKVYALSVAPCVYARRPSTTHCMRRELLVTALARTVTLFCVWLSAYVAEFGIDVVVVKKLNFK